ncbi:hypothetical protein ABPG72_006341 [Tetrahymena utriculariae]
MEITDLITSYLPYAFYLVGFLVLIPFSKKGFNFIQSFWVQSNPNQWLLVIQNGTLIKAGVGLKCFVLPNQTYVTFPSKIEKVSFNANNVTKEMQGLEVSGFAIWSVNREGDGPFKCYKYTQGSNANENVKIMCESIVRHQIANHALQEVLTNRNMLRDSMKVDLQKQLSGWGIWLETVEITDVKICSKSLFEDLQAEYRQEARLKAEAIRVETNNKVEKNKLESDLLLAKSRADTETERSKYQGEESIKRQTQQAIIQQKEQSLELQRIKQEQELQIARIQKDSSVQLEKKKKEQEQERLEKEFALEMFKKTVEAEKTLDGAALQKYIVDSTERIYQRLPLKEISVNSYIGPEGVSNISSLLPAISMVNNLQKK